MKNYFELRDVDPETYKKYKLPRYLKRELGDNKMLRILDLGCGYGQMLLRLKNYGYTNIQGADILKDCVDYCQKMELKATHIQSISEFAASIPEKFDVVIMSHVLEHIPKDEIIPNLKAIREGLLKPGGRLLVMVPNAQSNTNVYWRYEDFTHNLLFTAGSLQYVLKAAGFNNITFLDPSGTYDLPVYARPVFRFFQWLYHLNRKFWNLITLSYYHKPSPVIYTYELKARAHD
ncbi:MAG: class I SAM-dependent methyltransferase [Bacteroidota bacterium]